MKPAKHRLSAILDITALGGAALVVGGLWQMWHPLGLVGAGLFLLTFSIIGARKWA